MNRIKKTPIDWAMQARGAVFVWAALLLLMSFVNEIGKIEAFTEIARYVGLGVTFLLLGLLVFGLFCAWKASRQH